MKLFPVYRPSLGAEHARAGRHAGKEKAGEEKREAKKRGQKPISILYSENCSCPLVSFFRPWTFSSLDQIGGLAPGRHTRPSLGPFHAGGDPAARTLWA